MHALRSAKGFSLVEVLAAVGLLGVIYAIAAPAASTLRQKAGLVSAQREVMSTLYRTRSGAIVSNTSRRVVFTPPASIRVTDLGGTTTFYAANLESYHSDISIAGNNPVTVTYDARGLLNPPTTMTVTLKLNQLGSFQEPGYESKSVTVYPTGKPVAN